ncbi:hypothetical protein [Gordonia phthalatica]|uniref:Uncharacterized protein n=1 Tax=Gordonia phthalatica TaxID=1136941 RepID=A0A0N9NGA6_9ACTN|nr:hypothetical protein [Gordonia phthalatica]ALG84377.1 hypothetical protein ACH46_07530 [Gordonia phthalatica]
MTTEQLDHLVTTSRWDRLNPGVRVAMIIALIAPIVTVVVADTDWVRYLAAAAVLVVALAFGWVRETDGLRVPLN